MKCRQGKGFVAFLAKQVQDFERIIPTRNGTVPPPQGRGGTWYASTGNVRHVRCGGDGSSAPKHRGVPSTPVSTCSRPEPGV